jgi:hypothetical protein
MIELTEKDPNRFKGIQYRSIKDYNTGFDKFIYLFDRDSSALSITASNVNSWGINIRRINADFQIWAEQMLKHPFFCVYDGPEVIGVLLSCKEDLVMIKLVWGSI